MREHQSSLIRRPSLLSLYSVLRCLPKVNASTEHLPENHQRLRKPIMLSIPRTAVHRIVGSTQINPTLSRMIQVVPFPFLRSVRHCSNQMCWNSSAFLAQSIEMLKAVWPTQSKISESNVPPHSVWRTNESYGATTRRSLATYSHKARAASATISLVSTFRGTVASSLFFQTLSQLF